MILVHGLLIVHVPQVPHSDLGPLLLTYAMLGMSDRE